MIQKLPFGGFKWIENVDKFTADEIDRLVRKDQKGFVLEVDVIHCKFYETFWVSFLIARSNFDQSGDIWFQQTKRFFLSIF